MSYWDASALFKLYIAEPDSADFAGLAAALPEPMSTSAIAAPELLCAFHRRQRERALHSLGAPALYRQFCTDCEEGEIVVVPYGTGVIEEAERLVRLAFGQPQPVMIRALDLIHLASAIVSKADVLVTTDDPLRHLAAMAGVPVLPKR